MKVNIEASELKKILLANRKQHKKEFEEAWRDYKALTVEKVQKALKDVKAAKLGEDLRLDIYVTRPENHDADYQRVLGMLEISNNESIELSEQDYTEYVLDDWAWKAAFNATSAALKRR